MKIAETIFSSKFAVSVSAVALSIALAGCNGVIMPGLATTSALTQANLGDPRGNAGPATDELERAKTQFRERNFGLAEASFRVIVERHPASAEGWLGLAASYDQLRRFELADRAYGQVAKIAGESAVLHNNRGYSYLLRGDRQRARAEFGSAARLDPGNKFVRNNLKSLSGGG